MIRDSGLLVLATLYTL